MFKKGFSTAEILIVLVIVGIIAVAMMTTLRPNDKMYGKLTYKAYDILNTALYNINADITEYNEKIVDNANAIGDTANEDSLRRFPSDPIDLCNKLASREDGYINTSYTNCAQIYDSTDGLVDDDNNVIGNPTFVASNGMRFYLMNVNFALGSIDLKTTYYVMWVDVNGTKKPNSTLVTDTKKADTVPFFISKRNGTLVPTGIIAYDGSYLMAKTVYSTPDLTVGESGPRVFMTARNAAFGNSKAWTKDPMSATMYVPLSNILLQSFVLKMQPIPTKYTSAVGTATDPNCINTAYNTSSDFPPCTVKVLENK